MRVEEGGAEKGGGGGSAARLGVELRVPRPTLTSVNVKLEVVCRSYYWGDGRRRDAWADVDIAGAGSAAELGTRERV
jgi:hypothetical protein